MDTPYIPWTPLLPGLASPSCQACITIPVCNEEAHLQRCLDALAEQRQLDGAPMSHTSYEVLLLLNNCTDRSAEVVAHWADLHPGFALHYTRRTLAAPDAHAGTARKLLLDTALQRMAGRKSPSAALLCTDADTVVARDWVAQNMAALQRGADAVGGSIELNPEELQALPEQLRRCYERDRRYGQLVARLEDLLDPQPGDPWPRHQHHFGSSLACTPEAYRVAGGMPAVATLEDKAFVHELLRAGLRLRHEPAVRIFTSARLQGRATVGLASQLRTWAELPTEQAHTVQAASFLAHRFTTLSGLRAAFHGKDLGALQFPTEDWRHWAETSLHDQTTLPDFLGAIDCDGLIEATFQGPQEEQIESAIAVLERLTAGSPT